MARKLVSSFILISTLTITSLAHAAQTTSDSVGGSNPRPQGVGGSNPRPQTTTPTPDSVATDLIAALRLLMGL